MDGPAFGLKSDQKLFSDVKFVIAKCENSEEIKKILIEGGGTLIHYMSEIVTHVIADSYCPEAEEAVELYEKVVVKSLWVILSVKAQELLPTHAFSPLRSIFDNVIASFSPKLSVNDTEILAVTITYYGGKINKDSKTLTHFIVTEANEPNTPSGNAVKMVTPDWVIDSVKKKKCCSEQLYHPDLLEYRPPTPPPPPSPMPEPVKTTVITEQKAVNTITYSLNSQAKEFPLENCIFKLVEYFNVSEKTRQNWVTSIRHAGGAFDENLTKITHLLCETKCSIYKEAIKLGVRCVTVYWLNDVIAKSQLSPPWKVIHLPLFFPSDKRPLSGHIISATNFRKHERKEVKELILKLGAKYTDYMTCHNTLLICRDVSSEKYDKALVWKIPIANIHLLNDIYLNPTADLTAMLSQSKYQLFHYEDPFKLISYANCQEVVEAWRKPIKIVEKKEPLSINGEINLDMNEDSGIAHSLSTSPPNKTEKLEQKENNLCRESNDPVHILFTHFKPALYEKLKSYVTSLGISVVSSPQECTHLISDSICRTPKFICAFSNAKYILTSQWIKASFNAGKLLKEDAYVLNDPKGEEKFCFNLNASMKKRRKRGLIFKDIIFFVTHGVKPNLATISQMIESAGGVVASKKLPSRQQIEQMKASHKLFIAVSCLNDRHLCLCLDNLNIDVVTIEFVISGILRQEINIECHRLPLNQSPKMLEPNPAKKRRIGEATC